MGKYSRIYAEINLDAIRYNMEAMRANIAPATKICGVIKADGYGHGAVPVAKMMEDMVWGYATATLEEAVNLRKNHITEPILVLGYIPECSFSDMIQNEIRYTLAEVKKAETLSEEAIKTGKTARVHIKLDTGMSRLGVRSKEAALELAQRVMDLPNLEIEGIFTHMATADMADKTAAKKQIAMFKEAVCFLKQHGIKIPVCHCSNSAGIIDLEEANIDMVRAGISIYGLYPSEEVEKQRVHLKPAMALKSCVAYLKTVPAGTPIGYGASYVTERETKVATISAGYADGYPRRLSNRAQVLIRGKRAPIIGNVCMDQFMVDVTDIPETEEEDIVTLLGRDGEEEITAEELAGIEGTINYEFVCDIGKRVPRLYVRNGTVIAVKDYFCDYYPECDYRNPKEHFGAPDCAE